MTEAEWLSCGNLDRMLAFVAGLSDRKLRLFAVGCCRQVRGIENEEAARLRLELAEVLAGEASFFGPQPVNFAGLIFRSPCFASQMAVPGIVVAEEAARAARADHVRTSPPGPLAPLPQADLLRDIIGNPFHVVRFDPHWLARNEGAAARLAQVIAAEGRLELYPILADALEEAGCADNQVLAHCRSGKLHDRGCWVIDLMLAR